MIPIVVIICIVVIAILVHSVVRSDNPVQERITSGLQQKPLNTEAVVQKAREIYAEAEAKRQAELESKKQKEFQHKCQLANQKLASLGVEPLEWREVPRPCGEFGDDTYYALESTTTIDGVRLYFYPSSYRDSQLWTELKDRKYRDIYINTLEDLGKAIANVSPVGR